MTNKIKPYKQNFPISYACGSYTLTELLASHPEAIEEVYVHSSFIKDNKITALCGMKNIPVIYSDKAFNLVNQKENSYIIGVFQKYESEISPEEPHIVLVNPSDMGNLGTVIRTAAGLNIKNVAIITPAADIFNPKTIRASMGAIFRVKYEHFNSFGEYTAKYPRHTIFPFMTDALAKPDDYPPCRLFSLIFGNEANGLDDGFRHIGQPVKIPLSSSIDSFNLGVAMGIGAYVFAVKNNLV